MILMRNGCNGTCAIANDAASRVARQIRLTVGEGIDGSIAEIEDLGQINPVLRVLRCPSLALAAFEGPTRCVPDRAPDGLPSL
jgi:hypothetical protein